MFSNCTGLTNLDLSSFDIRNVTDMERMFSECGNLVTIFVGDEWIILEQAKKKLGQMVCRVPNFK